MASPCYDDFFVSTSENHYLVLSDSADKNPHPHRPSHTCQHWLGRHSHCQRLTTAAIIRHRPEMHNTEMLNAVTPRGTTPDKRSEICQILLTGAIYLKVSINCQTRVNEHLNWPLKYVPLSVGTTFMQNTTPHRVTIKAKPCFVMVTVGRKTVRSRFGRSAIAGRLSTHFWVVPNIYSH